MIRTFTILHFVHTSIVCSKIKPYPELSDERSRIGIRNGVGLVRRETSGGWAAVEKTGKA